MKTTRPLVLVATTVAVAFLTSVGSARFAAATTPPTVPTAPTTVAESGQQPVDPSQPADQGPVEVVHSWALAPAGSLDSNEAGNRPELSYEAAPGSVIEDAITVFNLGNVPLTFRVYATDAFNNEDGQFDILPGDDLPIDAGSWVSIEQENIYVEPGTQVTLPITVTIPADAAPGDHAAAIVASNVVTSDNEDGQVVNLDRRTGTRMYVRVSGPLSADLAVTDVQTTYSHALNSLSGEADVTFRIENRGNVRLSGTPTVSVSGPVGVGEQEVTLPDIAELLPGQDVTLTTKVKDVPALVVLSTTAGVTPTGSVDATLLKPTTAQDRTFAPPISFLLVLLAVLFGLMAWRAYRRHRGAVEAASDPVSAVGQEAQREPQPQTA